MQHQRGERFASRTLAILSRSLISAHTDWVRASCVARSRCRPHLCRRGGFHAKRRSTAKSPPGNSRTHLNHPTPLTSCAIELVAIFTSSSPHIGKFHGADAGIRGVLPRRCSPHVLLGRQSVARRRVSELGREQLCGFRRRSLVRSRCDLCIHAGELRNLPRQHLLQSTSTPERCLPLPPLRSSRCLQSPCSVSAAGKRLQSTPAWRGDLDQHSLPIHEVQSFVVHCESRAGERSVGRSSALPAHRPALTFHNAIRADLARDHAT